MTTLATFSKDLKLYNWPGFTPAGVYETPEDCGVVKTISWSNDGKSLMVVRGKDNPLILSAPFQADRRLEPSTILKNVQARAGAFANTSGTSAAFGGADGSVCIYDLKKRRIINEYQPVPSPANFLDFSREDTCLAAGCAANGQVVLYTSNPPPCASYAVPNSRSLSAVTFNKIRTDLLAAASKEGTMSVWNTSKCATLIVGRDHAGTVTDLDFVGDAITSVGLDGKIIDYDLRSSEYISCHNLNVPISGLAAQANSYEIVIGTGDGQLRCYDRRQMAKPVNTVPAHEGPVKKMLFQPCGPIKSRPATKDSELIETSNRRGGSAEATNKQQPSSAGDFNPDFSPSSSTIMSMTGEMRDLENIYLHEMLPLSASQIDIQKNSVPMEEFNRFAAEMEEHLRQYKKRVEDRMLAEFYQLRIEMSKQFIELQDKITKSWDGFMQYLKMSNEDASSAQIFEHAVSDVKSSRTAKSKKRVR